MVSLMTILHLRILVSHGILLSASKNIILGMVLSKRQLRHWHRGLCWHLFVGLSVTKPSCYLLKDIGNNVEIEVFCWYDCVEKMLPFSYLHCPFIYIRVWRDNCTETTVCHAVQMVSLMTSQSTRNTTHKCLWLWLVVPIRESTTVPHYSSTHKWLWL
jgi:hypothetical protein